MPKEQTENDSKSFGEYLKRERNMRGVTLEEICRSTNINMSFLESIENDIYDELPAEVFVKGFLRSYAKCIGTDPNEILLVYSEYSRSHQENIKSISGKDIDFIKKNNRKQKIILLAISVCILAGAALLSYYYYTPFNKKQRLSPESKSEIDSAIKIPDQSITHKEKTDQEQKKQDITQKNPPPPVSEEEPAKKPEKFSLAIYALEDVWLKVKEDEGDTQEALLHEGEEVTYTAEVFLLTLGNISGSIVTLDGEKITLPETNSNILRDFVIKKENPQMTEEE